MSKEELIVKEKRGVYLVNFHEDKYELLRDNGDLQYEDKIYNTRIGTDDGVLRELL